MPGTSFRSTFPLAFVFALAVVVVVPLNGAEVSGILEGQEFRGAHAAVLPFGAEEGSVRCTVSSEPLDPAMPMPKSLALMIKLPTAPGVHQAGKDLQITIFTPPNKNTSVSSGKVTVAKRDDGQLDVHLEFTDGANKAAGDFVLALPVGP